MRICVVTSTYNCRDDLQKTALSIREQTHGEIQWIVVDGASTDGTLDVIKNNADIIDTWISEPDSGIYNAWNKALLHLNGDWVIFLGAGDCFDGAITLELFSHELQLAKENVVLVYGKVKFVDKSANTKLIYGEVDLDGWDMCRPKLPCHQGVFQRRVLFKNPPTFDESYRIAADGLFMKKALKQGNLLYVDKVVCNMLEGGISAAPGKMLIAFNELKRSTKDMGLTAPLGHYCYAHIKIHCKYFLYLILPRTTYTSIAGFFGK